MGGVYEHPFQVVITTPEAVPETRETTIPLGRHLDGCRVGFDLGASDRKASAVQDGEVVFSEEKPWDPRHASDPRYHYEGVMGRPAPAPAGCRRRQRGRRLYQ